MQQRKHYLAHRKESAILFWQNMVSSCHDSVFSVLNYVYAFCEVLKFYFMKNVFNLEPRFSNDFR